METENNQDDFRVITAREAVRLRPSMYLGKVFHEGNLNALPIEVMCHAIDEYYDNNCSKVEITLYKDHFSVKYNSGLPLNNDLGVIRALTIMTSLFACKNQKKHLVVGEEFCELGIATVNFCSEYCHVNTGWQGMEAQFKFEYGELIEQFVESSEIQQEFTEMVFKPDSKIFGDMTFSFSGINKLLEPIRNKLPRLTIELNNLTNGD